MAERGIFPERKFSLTSFKGIGVGFGYFTSYASYNNKHSNAVQDALIIACSNSLIEVVAAFAVFGVIGYLGIVPEDQELGTFSIAFLTYPEALAQMVSWITRSLFCGLG